VTLLDDPARSRNLVLAGILPGDAKESERWLNAR